MTAEKQLNTKHDQQFVGPLVPSGKLPVTMGNPIFHGNIHYKWPYFP